MSINYEGEKKLSKNSEGSMKQVVNLTGLWTIGYKKESDLLNAK